MHRFPTRALSACGDHRQGRILAISKRRYVARKLRRSTPRPMSSPNLGPRSSTVTLMPSWARRIAVAKPFRVPPTMIAVLGVCASRVMGHSISSRGKVGVDAVLHQSQKAVERIPAGGRLTPRSSARFSRERAVKLFPSCENRKVLLMPCRLFERRWLRSAAQLNTVSQR
jgi:hypothetical protein